MPFVPGETIGPYRIIAQLGQGGMATVFKAYHPALDRFVALKAMHPAFLEEPNFLARFQREARLVAQLEHPHIVPIYDFSEHEGRPFLVMKFIDGETLKARLSRGPLEPDEVRRVVRAVGAALSYAHGQGILHRDIKPSNVLLAQDGRIYLTDFGLARIAQAGPTTLSSDVMLGTPQYISPEQARGESELGAGTDIYSFGVMLYEIVVGRVPFSADTPYSIIHDHIYAPLPLPSELRAGVSEPVERALLRALAKDPADRFEDVSSLVEVFLKAQESDAISVDLDAPGDLAGPDGDTLPPGAVQAGPTPVPRPSPPEAGVEPPADSPPARRWRWWYSIPLLVLVLACGLLAIGALQDAAGPAGTPTPPLTTDPTPVVDRPADDPVAAAQRLVEARPEDPFTHLALAAAMWQAGRIPGAQEAYERAQELAGDDPDFYVAAGDELSDRELWLLAAGMYIRAVQLLPGRPGEDLVQRLELSVYLASAEPESRVFLGERDRSPVLEPLLLEVSRARFQLYHEGPASAQEHVDEILGRVPEYPPARLLQAEILLNVGEEDAAGEILRELVEMGMENWVEGVARFYLEEFGL